MANGIWIIQLRSNAITQIYCECSRLTNVRVLYQEPIKNIRFKNKNRGKQISKIRDILLLNSVNGPQDSPSPWYMVGKFVKNWYTFLTKMHVLCNKQHILICNTRKNVSKSKNFKSYLLLRASLLYYIIFFLPFDLLIIFVFKSIYIFHYTYYLLLGYRFKLNSHGKIQRQFCLGRHFYVWKKQYR